MSQIILIKRSSTPGASPTTGDLELGELAINTYDGKLYAKKDDGSASVVEIGASAGGGGSSFVDTETITLSTTTETAIASFAIASFSACKFVVVAKDGSNRHATEILATHDGTTAIATQYASIFTSTALATYDVDISSGNLRLLATGASSNSTEYNITKVLAAE